MNPKAILLFILALITLNACCPKFVIEMKWNADDDCEVDQAFKKSKPTFYQTPLTSPQRKL